MPYQRLAIPDGTPPELEDSVRSGIDPRLADVHALFRLPVDGVSGLEAGGNLTIAQVLLDIVGGISTEIYWHPDLPKQATADRFRQALTQHYPWEVGMLGAVTGEEAANLLYDAFRCPLAHNLGLFDDVRHGRNTLILGAIKVAKGPLPDEKIVELEISFERPSDWDGATLRYIERPADAKALLVAKIFYWGVRRLVWNVLDACPALRFGPEDAEAAPAHTTTVSATATTALPGSGVTRITSGSTGPDEFA